MPKKTLERKNGWLGRCELGDVGGLQGSLRMPDVGPTETGHRDTELTDLVRGVALQIEIVLECDALRSH